MPQIPRIALAKSSAFCKSFFDWTRLAVAVATASAKHALLDKIITLSAQPKLKECPIVPEDVHIPKGVSDGLIYKISLFNRLDLPA